MSEKKYYLKPNVVIEPLVGKWYAWAHLISPATAAMNVVKRHLKIMTSYIQSPQIHAAAVLNPKMLGGPFMDYPTKKVDEIALLKERTVEQQSSSIEFAGAISELNQLLKLNARGYSLEGLYPKVPEALKGLVELVYDLNGNISYRFFEALLYQSRFYQKSSQSVALWVTNNDHRPFCLSTPRLESPDVLHLDISFDHPGIDALARMKKAPDSLTSISALLNINFKDKLLFESLFTMQEPPNYRRYFGSKVRMRYFGHACILIETADLTILVDPLVSYYGYESSLQHFSDIDIPDVIDYVLITHNHQDHIIFETLLPLRHRIKNLIVPRTTGGALQDPNLKLMFNAVGFNNVLEIGELEEIRFFDCVITGVPFIGEHSDLDIKAKICYHVKIQDFSFLFMADSRVMEPALYERVARILDRVDVLFLGMECDGAPLSWLYGPLLSEDIEREKDQSRRLSGSDFQKGIHLVDIFNPSEVYVYAMGQEPWLEFISSIKYNDESNPIVQSNLLIEECRKRDIVAERLYGEKEILYRQ